VLDIGCGGGRILERLARKAIKGKIVGIDYSEDAVAVARRRNRRLIGGGRVDVLHEAVSSMSFPDNTFDLITAIETHYFWPNFPEDLREVFRVLKIGGQLLIVGAVYKNKKFDRRNQRIVNAARMTYLTIEEYNEVLGTSGFTQIGAEENARKGWFCENGRRPV
jgi:ubiquinone/menaquinone biosynthesis C-methylase UbiE